jgi:glycosyltransferase involved in cell wall biosynthesis
MAGKTLGGKMDWKAKYLTKDDLDRGLDEARKKKAWGRWTLDKEAYPSLDIHPYPNNIPYQIRLFQSGCDFPKFTAWLGHWVQHLQDKGWMSYKDLWDFVDASQTIYRRETR